MSYTNKAPKFEKNRLTEDIKTFYVLCESFPAGVAEAFQKLKGLLPNPTARKYYGISCPNANGKIIYRAAVEELYEGEAKKLNCKTLTLKKGNYLACLIQDYETKTEAIGLAFNLLVQNPEIDPEGYCVEMYLDQKNVRCAVRLKN